MSDISSFLQNNFIFVLTFHILGTCLGLGGATISDITFFKFLKDFRISKKETEVLHLLKNIMLAALALIIVTGIGLYLSNPEQYHQSTPFMIKMIAVGIVTINGVLLHVYVAPYLIHLNLDEHKKMGRKWHRFAFALGGISIVSWYSIFFIAMTKSLITLSFWELLGIYVCLLILGILGSQVVEAILSRKAKHNLSHQ